MAIAKTKTEIEAEIARLTAQLHAVVPPIDPAFTPSELVRWDPSLEGALLHIKHERLIPRNAFEYPLAVCGPDYKPETWKQWAPSELYGSSNPSRVHESFWSNKSWERSPSVMENVGVLTGGGIQSATEELYISHGGGIVIPKYGDDVRKYKYGTYNNFTAMTELPMLFEPVRRVVNPGPLPAHYSYGPTGWNDLSCASLGMTVKRCNFTDRKNNTYFNLVLPLANPDKFLLDQLFVATSTRLLDADVIIDRYPLSVLYQEWKRDMEAAVAYAASLPPVMSKKSGRLMPHHVTRPTRKTEFDKTKALLADLQAEVQRLRAERETEQSEQGELSKQNERLRTALHVAANIPTNATNATASSTDPV